MPKISVLDLGSVQIDGVDAGCITDVIANHKLDRGELLAALQAWHDSHCCAHEEGLELAKQAYAASLADSAKAATDKLSAAEAAHAAAVASLGEQHAAAVEAIQRSHAEGLRTRDEGMAATLADIRGQHAREMSRLQARLDSATAKVDEQRAMIDALGGTELGQRMAKDAEVKKARDDIAKAQAVLAGHGETP